MRQSNLDLLFGDETGTIEEPKPLWTQKHLEANRKHWATIKKGSAMWDYNKKWYGNYLTDIDDRDVLYLAKAEVQYLSDWAKEEAKSRKIL